MTTENTYNVGKRGEEYVRQRLYERGLEILGQNVSTKFAEIDIVAKDDDTLCFIEVRTRTDETMGHPAQTVNLAKQHNLRRAAEAYLQKNRIGQCPVRFDVATLIWSSMEFEYFENAF